MKIATLQKFTGGEVSCTVDGVYQSDFTTPEDAEAWLKAHHAERVHDGKPTIRNGKNDTVSGRWEVDDDADEIITDKDDEVIMHACKFCHCLDATDSAHSCLEFTEAGNAPDGTPEHELWEAVMHGIDTGFVNIDGSEE